MTGKEFIHKIIGYYQEAKELNDGGFNIWRGVSRSISGQSEDLFAYFVAQKLNDKSLEFIVDKTMNYRIEDNKSISFRPDLAIIKDDVITHIIDLKMDMGYKRRYHESSEFQKERMKFDAFRNQMVDKVTYRKYTGDKDRVLKVSKNIVNQVVVISEKNEGKSENRTDMINAINQLDWIHIYYLSGGIHPNSGEKTKDNIEIREEEFNRLFKDIKTNLA